MAEPERADGKAVRAMESVNREVNIVSLRLRRVGLAG